ncbi:phosphate regulon sensor histidine kinase PhoR [Rodentibacter haemolyticus]|uniref:Phosphate regulon sensor protein PhoR n=1 Tax=Rodentibacter haemolyticus TaxID=2778911 RepID=A0ABX6UWW1_9PAST|nr:phosphate regulon sensor histidine kinase PhoR [Rodentibacter haemolyticus]QPB42590.1 phosphate regulon sensor histidine kinase PhoR [Rodentibacter haemolyticus]
MMVFLPALLRFIFLLAFLAGISYLAGGIIALWVSISAVLLSGIIYQLVYLNRLIRWLNDQQNELYGSGIWGNIFDKTLALRKASQKRKKELSASITRFNQMIDTIPNGIIILNEGRIEWFNSLACKHLNLNYQNDLNSILQNLIRQPDFQQFLQQRIDNQPLVLKLSLPNGDYFKRIIQISRQPFEQHSELLITQDITKKEQLDEAQVAFVANVSHELRTPLTVINGFTETLLEMPDLSVEQRQQFLSLMQKEGQRMLSVLSDLLTLSRLERGQSTDGKYRRFNLSEMVKQVVESTKNFSQGQHQFVVDITPDLYFYGLEAELYSAFSNLTFNAVRYTPEQGSITIRLHILETDKVEFSVTDTGVGIATEHIPRLTERFYRVDNARSRQTGGTGLGLAITKFALAKYNAKLDISSEVGKGSCFKTILSLN